MEPVDTLQVSQQVLQRYHDNPDFDYKKELLQVDEDVWQQVVDWVRSLFPSIGSWSFYDDHEVLVWTVVGIVILLLAFAFLWVRRPQLFGRPGANHVDYHEEQDTIEGVDFPAEIHAAWQLGDYCGVVRLNYLHTLKLLNDAQKIDWRIYKTPTQYTREVTTHEFGALTALYLRVRYGGYVADKTLASQAEKLRQSVVGAGLEGGDR